MTATTTNRAHPVYLAALGKLAPLGTTGAPFAGAGAVWVDTADTARLIRDTLARAFPSTRFYVRLRRYAGGSSVDVAYDGVELDPRGRPYLVAVDYDGAPLPGAERVTQDEMDYRAHRYAHVPKVGAPALRDVSAIVAPFEGRGFDGFIDLAYSVEAWLNPDGSVTFAGTRGTEGSHGAVPAAYGSRRHPSAVLIHSGASYVHASDVLPYDIRHKARAS